MTQSFCNQRYTIARNGEKFIGVWLTRPVHHVLVSLALILCGSAQAADVSGTVQERGVRKPVAGAVVTIQGGTESAVSDEQGRYRLKLPGTGRYTLQASKPGEYDSAVSEVSVTEQAELGRQDFYLMPLFRLPEVLVVSDRTPDRISKTVISGKQLNRIAGTSGDPLAGLQTLPGVVSTNNGSRPAVRGSGPGDNAYYVDGLVVGKIFHVAGISVFNADLISDFNLYSAAFAPRFGDVTGAVLDVALRNPRTDQLGGKLNINMLGADALIEGPVGEDQSFYFAARRSYIDLFLKQVQQEGVTLQIPNYSDYQGKYIRRLSATDKLTFHVQGAADALQLNIGGESDIAQKQPVLAGNIALSDAYAMQALVWDATVLDSARNTLALEHIAADVTNSVASAGNLYLAQDAWLLREHLNLLLSEGHELALGANLSQTQISIDADIKNATCTQFNPACDLTSATQRKLVDRFTSNAWDASLQDRKRISSSLVLVAGARHSYEGYLSKSYTEPRIGLEWEATAQTLVTAGWGRHNQMPTGQQIANAFGNPRLGHLRADHSVLGVSHRVDDLWSWKAETYFKRFSDLVVDDPQLNYVNGASGSAYGLELLVKKDSGERLSGWMSLSLARSERRNDLTGEAFRFELDQPVNATLVSSYQLNDDWSLDAKWSGHSGTPYTPVTGTNGSYADGRLRPRYAAINSGTLPMYHRLDLRMARQLVRDTYKLNLYFELNNVYGRQNIVGYTYDASYTVEKPVYPFVLPFSFGVQAEF